MQGKVIDRILVWGAHAWDFPSSEAAKRCHARLRVAWANPKQWIFFSPVPTPDRSTWCDTEDSIISTFGGVQRA